MQEPTESRKAARARRVLSEIYDHSYLIFFSILGVLACLGLVTLTSYPGAPLATTAVWANVGGSLVIGSSAKTECCFADTGTRRLA